METPKIYTKEYIKQRILDSKDNRWFHRAVLAIYKGQTPDEKSLGETKEHNDIGFNAFDAKFLTDIAINIKKNKPLSPQQNIVGRRKIVKYCGQLEKIANSKI